MEVNAFKFGDHHMKIILTSFALFAASFAHASEDRTIWLQAGHCIVLGGQQICAANSDATMVVKPANKNRDVCKNGVKDEADAKLTGWAHVVITTGPDGKKMSEEVMKTFGPMGKAACEAHIAKQ